MSSKTWTDEDLKEAVPQSICWSDVCRELDLTPTGSNPRRVRERADELSLDTSHFDKRKAYSRGTGFEKTPLEDILTKNSDFSTYRLKQRLVERGTLDDKCSRCGLEEWNDEPISLHLDHINGNPRDQRLCNLRLLCPNCHSQTSTYGGKNVNTDFVRENHQGHYSEHNECLDCETRISNNATRCKSCAQRNQNTKIDWPSNEKLAELVWEKPRTKLADELGVSDKAIEKRCRRRDIETPEPGYWQKQQAKTVEHD